MVYCKHNKKNNFKCTNDIDIACDGENAYRGSRGYMGMMTKQFSYRGSHQYEDELLIIVNFALRKTG